MSCGALNYILFFNIMGYAGHIGSRAKKKKALGPPSHKAGPGAMLKIENYIWWFDLPVVIPLGSSFLIPLVQTFSGDLLLRHQTESINKIQIKHFIKKKVPDSINSSCCRITCFHVLVPCYDVRYDFILLYPIVL